jgi:hypothetical protein
LLETKELSVFEKGYYHGRKGWYGWFGFGGSVMQWHPEAEIGFGYLPSDLQRTDVTNHRGARLQAIVTKIANRKRSNKLI